MEGAGEGAPRDDPAARIARVPLHRAGHILGSARAGLVDLPGFSVHADADDMIAWLSNAARPPSVTYVVHGEPEAARTLRDRIGAELGRHAAAARTERARPAPDRHDRRRP